MWLLQPGYMPPLGASPYTWPNIFKNMKRMDYCVDKFDFLGNREVPPLFPSAFSWMSISDSKCRRSFVGGCVGRGTQRSARWWSQSAVAWW